MKRFVLVILVAPLLVALFFVIGCDQTPTVPILREIAPSKIEWRYFSRLLDGQEGFVDPGPLESFWSRHPDWEDWSVPPINWSRSSGLLLPPLGFGEEPGQGGKCDLQAKVYFDLPEGHPTRAKLFFVATRCNGDPAIPMRITGVPEHFYNIPVQAGENVVQLERLPDWAGTSIPLLVFDQPPYSSTPRALSEPDPGLEFEIRDFKLIFDDD